MKLKLLLDSADPRIWEDLIPTGVFQGITTNPSLLKQAEQKCDIKKLKKLAQKAEAFGCKELHIQAWGKTSDELIQCGTKIGRLSSKSMNVHVKVPLTKEGTKAAFKMIKNKLSITFTACFDVEQVLIAASLEATY